MKIHFEHKSTVFDLERKPMPDDHFRAVCKLAGTAIGGAVLLVAVHEVGIWAIAWAAGVGLAVGFGKLMLWLCKSVK